MSNGKEHYFDKPENVNFVLRIFYAVCGLLLITDIFYHRHVIHSLEDIFGFYTLYGFVACVALVRIATYMRKVIMRDEDYYDDR
ncbi:MAG: hypothetical protein KAI77_03260 [Gammaproteobacteria bacterium]|nr:hypothetical protein [Gammaproteobacteria bacterium]